MASKQPTLRKKCHMLLWKVEIHVEIPYYDNTKMFSIPCFLNKCFTCKNVHAFHTASWPSAVCTDSKTNSATQSQVMIDRKCIHVHYFKKTEQALSLEQSDEWIWCEPACVYWFSQIRLQNLPLRFYSYKNRENICASVSVHISQSEASHTFPVSLSK